jgi:lysophospholipase L1-like esterase
MLLTVIVVTVSTRTLMTQELAYTASNTGSSPTHGSSGQAAPGAPTPRVAPTGHGACECLTDHDRVLLTDFGGLTHYQAADAALVRPAPGENRVVFIGDSITASWKIEGPDGTFPGKPYINRGIGGQTTPQMLVRFRQDVIDLQPKVVVIMAGTNDIAGNTGPMTLKSTEDNLVSMADLSASQGIRVVLCSVTPTVDYPWNPGLNPAPKINALNAWIKDYASRKGYIYVDYYSALKDEHGGLPPTLSKDGVHPLPAGFAIMAPLAESGIEKALAR